MHSASIPISTGIKGHFKLLALKNDGSGSRLLAEFDNLILDNGLDYWLSNGNSTLNYCRIGSGSVPANVSQTALTSQVASTDRRVQDTPYAGGSNPDFFFSHVRRWRFPTGQSYNVAEIGTGWGETGATLFSRALVVDGNGNPTVVSVLSDETLEVSYTITIYPSPQDSLATLNLNGTSYEVRSRFARAIQNGYWNRQIGDSNIFNGGGMQISQGGLGPLTGGISGSVSDIPASGFTLTRKPYAAGTFYLEADFVLGADVANFNGGFSALEAYFLYMVPYQFAFTPAVPKTSSQVFRLTFRLTFTRR